jgi:hypothetical protein
MVSFMNSADKRPELITTRNRSTRVLEASPRIQRSTISKKPESSR